jgi:hypothetical protein
MFSTARVVAAASIVCSISVHRARSDDAAFDQYFLVNVHAREINPETFDRIKRLNVARTGSGPRLGVGAIISYLRSPRDKNVARLRQLLDLCRQHRLAVLVQLDGEQWWNDRPDLWNWWDASKPGFDPENAANVEWSGWGSEHALRISWRDWGQQLRMLPPPNLMSPRYREACHAEMRPLVDEVVRWRDSLAEEEKWLFVGVKVGWESAIGMSNHYYPNGNELLGRDPDDDPQERVKPKIMPGRGFQPIGYAAVTTAGLAGDGELREEHLAEVVRRHLAHLSKAA